MKWWMVGALVAAGCDGDAGVEDDVCAAVLTYAAGVVDEVAPQLADLERGTTAQDVAAASCSDVLSVDGEASAVVTFTFRAVGADGFDYGPDEADATCRARLYDQGWRGESCELTP